MRNRVVYFLLTSALSAAGLLAQSKTTPAKLVFPAKFGNVTFDHAAHSKREKNDCKMCHPAPFVQDAKAPLGFRPPHKNEEDKKASCGMCHRPGGAAFATQGNCNNSKCHLRFAGSKAGTKT